MKLIIGVIFLMLFSCKEWLLEDKICGVYRQIQLKNNGNPSNLLFLNGIFTNNDHVFVTKLHQKENEFVLNNNHSYGNLFFKNGNKEVFLSYPINQQSFELPFRGNWKVKKLTKYRLELEADSAGTKWELIMDQRPPK